MSLSSIMAGPPNRGQRVSGPPFSEIRNKHTGKQMKFNVPAKSACAPRPPSEARYAMHAESTGHPPFGAPRGVFGAPAPGIQSDLRSTRKSVRRKTQVAFFFFHGPTCQFKFHIATLLRPTCNWISIYCDYIAILLSFSGNYSIPVITGQSSSNQ